MKQLNVIVLNITMKQKCESCNKILSNDGKMI